MIDFLKKYVIRIYSIVLIGLAICEICFVGIYKKNNMFICVNIASNFIFAIIGFAYSLNPFYNFNFNWYEFWDDFWNFDDINNTGYSALRMKLFKSTISTIFNSIGIALYIKAQRGNEFMPLFIAEIIMNCMEPIFLILKLIAIYFSYLFFPDVLPYDRSLLNLSPIGKHFLMYYLRYIAVWVYFLCGYEIFATYKINQNDNCRERKAVSITILNSIVNFIIGAILIVMPLNEFPDEGAKCLLLIKFAIVSIPTVFIYISTSCPNLYLASVLILETGLHVILPICVIIIAIVLIHLIPLIICLFEKIMHFFERIISVDDLAQASIPNTANTSNTTGNNPTDSLQTLGSNQQPQQPESTETILSATATTTATNFLETSKLNKYVTVNKFEDINCIICCDDIDRTKKYAMLGCSHNFHIDCIEEFIKKQNNGAKCPMCAKNMDVV